MNAPTAHQENGKHENNFRPCCFIELLGSENEIVIIGLQ